MNISSDTVITDDMIETESLCGNVEPELTDDSTNLTEDAKELIASCIEEDIDGICEEQSTSSVVEQLESGISISVESEEHTNSSNLMSEMETNLVQAGESRETPQILDTYEQLDVLPDDMHEQPDVFPNPDEIDLDPCTFCMEELCPLTHPDKPEVSGDIFLQVEGADDGNSDKNADESKSGTFIPLPAGSSDGWSSLDVEDLDEFVDQIEASVLAQGDGVSDQDLPLNEGDLEELEYDRLDVNGNVDGDSSDSTLVGDSPTPTDHMTDGQNVEGDSLTDGQNVEGSSPTQTYPDPDEVNMDPEKNAKELNNNHIKTLDEEIREANELHTTQEFDVNTDLDLEASDVDINGNDTSLLKDNLDIDLKDNTTTDVSNLDIVKDNTTTDVSNLDIVKDNTTTDVSNLDIDLKDNTTTDVSNLDIDFPDVMAPADVPLPDDDLESIGFMSEDNILQSCGDNITLCPVVSSLKSTEGEVQVDRKEEICTSDRDDLDMLDNDDLDLEYPEVTAPTDIPLPDDSMDSASYISGSSVDETQVQPDKVDTVSPDPQGQSDDNKLPQNDQDMVPKVDSCCSITDLENGTKEFDPLESSSACYLEPTNEENDINDSNTDLDPINERESCLEKSEVPVKSFHPEKSGVPVIIITSADESVECQGSEDTHDFVDSNAIDKVRTSDEQEVVNNVSVEQEVGETIVVKATSSHIYFEDYEPLTETDVETKEQVKLDDTEESFKSCDNVGDDTRGLLASGDHGNDGKLSRRQELNIWNKTISLLFFSSSKIGIYQIIIMLNVNSNY